MEFSFGDYLRQTILLLNLNQRQAAKLVHLSPQAFNNYVANKRVPDMKTMAHIMQVFHMDANRVFHIQSHQDLYDFDEDEIALILKYRKMRTQYQAMLQHVADDLIQDGEHVKKQEKKERVGKMRKMLGDIHSQECKDLMDLIETQSKQTLTIWAISFTRKELKPVIDTLDAQAFYHQMMDNCLSVCEGTLAWKECLSLLKEGTQRARMIEDPIKQACVRCICTACNVYRTPGNALGYLFYGAAASAYHTLGLNQTKTAYDAYALSFLQKAFTSLKAIANLQEPHPVKITWNCETKKN